MIKKSKISIAEKKHKNALDILLVKRVGDIFILIREQKKPTNEIKLSKRIHPLHIAKGATATKASAKAEAPGKVSFDGSNSELLKSCVNTQEKTNIMTIDTKERTIKHKRIIDHTFLIQNPPSNCSLPHSCMIAILFCHSWLYFFFATSDCRI